MKTIITNIPNREALLTGKGSVSIGYPWLSFGATIALEYIVNKDFKVLEFGAGGSTIFWAKNCQSIKSFETSPEWIARIKKVTGKLKNIEIILANEAEMLKALSKEPDNCYDLVLVDCEPKRNRRLVLANASKPKIKLGGWLVLDNYNRFSLNDFDYTGFKIYTFDEFNYQGSGTRLCQKTK